MAEEEDKNKATLKRDASITYYGHHFDSKRWDLVKVRKNDIIISTAYKAGTTWTQAILANLLFQDESKFPGPPIQIAPWVDMRVPPPESLQALEAQTFRRFVKTHLPADGLPLFEEPKYVAVFRDPRDVFFSLYNHWCEFSDSAIGAINSGSDYEPLDFPPKPVNEAFREWLNRGYFEWEKDGWPFWSCFRHAETWWEIRDWPNVLFVHYNDLKKDVRGQMKRIAEFCEIQVEESLYDQLVENVSLANMKKKNELYLGSDFAKFFKHGGDSFLNKGTNGRWRDVLTPEELELYDQVKAKYPQDMAQWLENGGQLP